ncbi:MAG: methyltransferase [Chlamydiae bacterium]|nr:methyltransferase [Chlamydiota bacterium]
MNYVIDWEEIWKIHAPHYKDGYAKIPLRGNKELILKPGPGFGDLSHPSTNLMLKMLKPLVKDKVVVDIGCGSGILSIASMLLGAKKVYAFEIEQDAISHAKENFLLNNVDIEMNKHPDFFDLVCINMISSEQKIAFAQYPFLKNYPHLLLASGLLKEEKERYLREMSSYRFIKEKKDECWMSLCMQYHLD